MPANNMTQDMIDTIKNPRAAFNQRLKDMAKTAENSGELVKYTGKSREDTPDGYMMALNESTINGSGVDKNLHLMDRKVRGGE